MTDSLVAHQLELIVQDFQGLIPVLDVKSNIVTSITLALIVLGAASTIVALVQSARVKWITASVGALIVILTGVRDKVYHADAESFESVNTALSIAVAKARNDIASFRTAEESGKLNPEDTAFSTDFAADRKALEELSGRLMKLGVRIPISAARSEASVSNRLLSIPVVYAASTVPKWVGTPRPRPNALIAVGSGNCSTPAAAREYARYDARRRIALQLEKSPTPERLDALIDSLDNQVTDHSNFLADFGTGLLTNYTETSLTLAFRPAVAKINKRPEPRFVASALFAGEKVVASTQKAKGIEGDFQFVFQVAGSQVSLQQIVTISDSMIGSTRWAFDVRYEGNRLFSIPERRYEDSGKPTVCRVLPDEHLEGTIPPGASGGTIKILGYKPKDF